MGLTNLTSSIPGLRIQHCHELWCRPAATALIQSLAWKLPFAAGTAEKTLNPKPPQPPYIFYYTSVSNFYFLIIFWGGGGPTSAVCRSSQAWDGTHPVAVKQLQHQILNPLSDKELLFHFFFWLFNNHVIYELWYSH